MSRKIRYLTLMLIIPKVMEEEKGVHLPSLLAEINLFGEQPWKCGKS